MRSTHGQVNVSLNIAKHDQDIADWLNKIINDGYSPTKIISALLIAFDRGEVLDVGRVSTPPENLTSSAPKKPSNPHNTAIFGDDSVLFGFGDAQTYLEKKSKPGWSKRGSKNELVIGSSLMLTLTNKRSIEAYNRLISDGYRASTTIKETLRECWKSYPDSEKPDIKAINYLLTNRPKKQLKKPDYGFDLDDSPQNSKQSPKRPAAPIQTEEVANSPAPESKKEPTNEPPKWRNPLLDLI